jgi:hypothetical protein
MEKINFSTIINAPKEKVWNALWEDSNYRNWAAAFYEGSYAQTDNWKVGSKVLFLGPGGSGMVSKVAANKPYEFMSFEHQGEVKDGVEDTTSERVKPWAGAHENYTLTEAAGKTTLIVEMDITEEFKDYFVNTWPVALQKLKELAEKD